MTDAVDLARELRQRAAEPGFGKSQVQAIFDFAIDAIVLTDDNGKYLEANPAACVLLGVSRENLLTARVLDVVAPAMRDAFEEQWRAFLSAGHQSGAYALVRPDGSVRDVEFRAMAHVMPGMHLSILRDVTRHLRGSRGRRSSDRRQEILSAIDGAILGASSPLTAVDAVVQRVAALFGALRATVILFDRVTRNARILAVWPLQPTRVAVGADLPMPDDVVGPEVLESRGFIRSDLEDVTPRSWIDHALFDEGARSLIRVPLRAKAGIIGALEISSGDSHAFDDEQLAVALEVADHVAVAIASARLFEEVQVTSARLVAMSKRLVEVQEVERREVARELHDEIGQELTALKLQIDLAMKTATAPTADALTDGAQLVQGLLSRVRRLSLNLRPPLLDDFGLQKALLAHFERYTAQTTVEVAFSSAGLSDQRFAVEVETASFRIVQESLTNVARHAGTGHVDVDVHVIDGRVHVSVTDHGRGCIADRPMNGGVGVTGMHERVALLGGSFHISSSAGGGTTVTAQIPLHIPGRHS